SRINWPIRNQNRTSGAIHPSPSSWQRRSLHSTAHTCLSLAVSTSLSYAKGSKNWLRPVWSNMSAPLYVAAPHAIISDIVEII
uniref:Uncharacterized protein n=1 Tax=Mesocestoides corti TaxID=53468 RepID=A0A5K3F8H7_MESCO